MQEHPLIIFVCEHGAAKSIIAAAHFNEFARKKGSNLRAIARGTNPDAELSEQTVKGLAEDGLSPTESAPRKLSLEETSHAQKIISFCELPEEYKEATIIEQWEHVPAVSENYEKARDAIIDRLEYLLKNIRSSP